MYKISVLFLIFCLNLFGQIKGTIIPDSSNVFGNWTKAGSPYTIQGKAFIATGTTLNIESGVEIKFKTSESSDVADFTYQTLNVGMLYIKGKLSAIGTKTEPIVFTRNGNAGNWGTIIFDDLSDDNSKMTYCNIEYACTVKKFDGTNDLPGAISFHKSSPTIEYCIIRNNGKVFGDYNLGCGVLSFRSSPKIISCQIYNNKTQGFYGISDYQQNTVPILISNLIYGNKPAIDLVFTDPKIINCTVAGNLQCGLSGMYANPVIVNSIFYGNPITFIQSSSSIKASFSVIQETSLPAGVVNQGNLLLGYDPKFINSTGFNFNLQNGSLCIDNGNSNISGIVQPAFDCNGNNRISGTKIDFGASESNYNTINVLDKKLEISLDNYPNPFNNTTSIKYFLQESTELNLSIYNSQGQMIKNLVHKNQPAGNYSVRFNADDLNSGVYYCKLVAGNKAILHKMLLVK